MKWNIAKTKTVDWQLIASLMMKINIQNIAQNAQQCQLASKGFNIQKYPLSVSIHFKANSIKNSKVSLPINEKSIANQRRNPREAIIGSLKQSISSSNKQLNKKYTQIQQSLSTSEYKYGHLIQQINQYFGQIESIVEYQKYLAYNKILQQRVKQEKNARQLKEYINYFREELDQIDVDLEQNYFIAKTVSTDQFNLIIKNYQSKINQVASLLSIDPSIKVYQSLHFPEPSKWLQMLQLICIKKEKQIIQQCGDDQENTNQIQHNILKISNFSVHQNQFQDLNQKQYWVQDTNYNQCRDQKNNRYLSENSCCFQSQNLEKTSFDPTFPSKTHQKQILLKNSFSIASSINDDRKNSSDDQGQNDLIFSPECIGNNAGCNDFYSKKFIKSYKSSHILGKAGKIDSFLSDYEMKQSFSNYTNQINCTTVVENNQTMLLNQ